MILPTTSTVLSTGIISNVTMIQKGLNRAIVKKYLLGIHVSIPVLVDLTLANSKKTAQALSPQRYKIE